MALPPGGQGSLTDVVVAIPTFRRPSWLTRLLRELEKIETPARLSIIVADNDAESHGGADVCARLSQSGYRWPLRAVIVDERGISQARNALMAAALADGARFVAMLDDDEWPSAGWLAHLLAVQQQTQADVVQGPVLCEFAYDPPPWAELANTSVPPRTGSGVIPTADAGGNVLFSTDCLRAHAPQWFDPAFGLTGGEDKDFFVRLARTGTVFAWAAEAIAYTSIPQSRMSRSWALRRAFRSGNCDMRIAIKYGTGAGRRLEETAKMIGGLLLSPLTYGFCLFSPRRRTRASLTFARALGKAAAALGLRYREYRSTHGA